MKKSLILVEGIADLVFIKDFIEIHNSYFYTSTQKIDDKTKEINIVHDNESFVKIFVLRSKEALDNGNTFKLIKSEINKEDYNNIILILDADENFDNSETLAQKYLTDLNMTNFYLFPNNEEIGDLETILENIQVDKNIANCWSKFETCINESGEGYTIPAKKSKIHTYLEVLNPNTNKGKDNCKERNRNYKDIAIWTLSDLKNPYILKLKTFLDQYLK
jgi:hypothetical protein